MAREKKATGDAPKKRTSRSKAPVAAQQSPDNETEQTLTAASAGSNGGSTTRKQTFNIGDEVVRRRAYEIWEQRGCQHGKDADDWFRAETELRGKSA